MNRNNYSIYAGGCQKPEFKPMKVGSAVQHKSISATFNCYEFWRSYGIFIVSVDIMSIDLEVSKRY